jgi:hypothetical protein
MNEIQSRIKVIFSAFCVRFRFKERIDKRGKATKEEVINMIIRLNFSLFVEKCDL